MPTATNTGINTGSRFCRLYGSHQAFDAATIASLYPTHADYVSAVRDAALANLEAGYIVDFDAAATIWEAELSDIGGRRVTSPLVLDRSAFLSSLRPPM